MKRFLLFASLLLMAISCGRSVGLVRQMKDIESYVHDAPDSALAMLAAMDTSSVSSARVEALYTLLNSIARYRLYVDEEDDAALMQAAAFFRSRRDDARLMKTLFLAGNIQYNQGNYKQAILSLTEADLLVEELGDHFYGGLICRQLAQAFSRSFNNVDCLRSISDACQHFLEGNYHTHGRYALLLKGEAYSSNSLYEESERVFKEVIASAREYHDTVLWAKALLSYADNLIVRNDSRPQESLQHIIFVRDSLHYPIPCHSWANAAFCAAMLNNTQISDSCFVFADQLAKTEYDRYLVSFRKYESALELNRPQEALAAANESFKYLIETHMTLERDSSVDIQRDYFDEIGENERLRHRLTKQRFVSILLFVILLCIGLAWVIRKLVIKGRLLQGQNKVLSTRVQEMEQSDSRRLKIALESGMRFFNKLAEFKWVSQPEKILPSFETMLSNLATDKQTIQEMMGTLNKTHNGLMTRLENQVPSLKKDDLLVYCYLAHQFDHMTLCTILNRTPGALNSKIYRLREKIEKSHAPDKEEFLDAIKCS